MPKITIHLGGHEQLQATISKATPMGLLGTEAIVRLGAAMITGSATALRALADALVEAAGMAEAYDADPEGFNQRERERAECAGEE
jgi:hypothetical protein